MRALQLLNIVHDVKGSSMTEPYLEKNGQEGCTTLMEEEKWYLVVTLLTKPNIFSALLQIPFGNEF